MATSAIDQITRSGLAPSVDFCTVDQWISHRDSVSALLFSGRAERRRGFLGTAVS